MDDTDLFGTPIEIGDAILFQVSSSERRAYKTRKMVYGIVQYISPAENIKVKYTDTNFNNEPIDITTIVGTNSVYVLAKKGTF